MSDRQLPQGSDGSCGQESTPYLDAISEHLRQDVLSFAIPGHGGGPGAGPRLQQFLGPAALAADLTEVLGIDDLHRPNAQCRQAQQLAAVAFGAEETHFLINGSTSGNQAMLLATSGPGEVVLLPRNAHRSLWGGLLLSGATGAVYEPVFDRELGVYGAPTVACLQAAYEQAPEAKVIVLSSPTYYGHACDTEAVVAVAHELGLTVLVDEAWGAHLAFHPDYPTSAVHAGADLVVQSSHKMLPSLTQTAMLHVRGSRVDRARLRLVLRTLLSSSPSALLVSSLDAARHYYATDGRELLTELAELATEACRRLNACEGILCRGGRSPNRSWNPTQLVVSALGRGYNGHELEQYLRYQHRIAVEMSELFGVVLVFTSGHRREHLERLLAALEQLPQRDPVEGEASLHRTPPPFPRALVTPRATLGSRWETVTTRSAVGRRSAETVTLYPPGIPWLLPDEEIQEAVLAELQTRQRAGGSIEGASDPSLETLQVLPWDSL